MFHSCYNQVANQHNNEKFFVILMLHSCYDHVIIMLNKYYNYVVLLNFIVKKYNELITKIKYWYRFYLISTFNKSIVKR